MTEKKTPHRARVLLIGAIPPPIGGISIHMQRLCQALELEGFPFTHIDARRNGVLATLVQIARHELCHINVSNPMLMLLLTGFCTLIGKKNILSIRGDFSRHLGLKRLCFRMSVALTQIPVFLNEGSMRAGSRVNPAAILSSTFIPPVEQEPLDPEIEAQILERRQGKSLVVMTTASNLNHDANNREIYGIFPLIEELASRPYLLVVSDPSGTYVKVSQDRYSPTNLKHVLFITRPHSFYSLLRHADVFVRNTTTDGDSPSIHEALHLGKTVWATPVVSRPKGVYRYAGLNAIDWHAAPSQDYRQPAVVSQLMDLYQSMLLQKRNVLQRIPIQPFRRMIGTLLTSRAA